MSKKDLNEILEAADPCGNDSSVEHQPKRAKDALFEELTMEPSNTKTKSRKYISAPAWWQKPTLALPAALGAFALIVGGLFVVSTINAPSAVAEVTAAADKSAAITSGRADVVVEFSDMPEGETGKFTFVYRFDGENSSTVHDFSNVTFPGDQDSEIVSETFETIEVDGKSYASGIQNVQGPAEWIELPEDENFDVDMGGGLFDADETDPALVVSLIEEADDFKKIGTEDGVSEFSGTLSTITLRKQDASKLPAGLSIIAESYETDSDSEEVSQPEDLPETVGIVVKVEDGLLSTVVVNIDGDTEIGYTKATITTTYSEFGEPQNITAPPAELIASFEDFQDELTAEMPDEVREAFELTTEAGTLCLDENTESEDDRRQCFIDAGRPDLAEAWDTLNEFYGVPGLDNMPAEVEAAMDTLDALPEGKCDEFYKNVRSETDLELAEEKFVKCLEDAGETEAVEAHKTIAEWDASLVFE